MENSGLNALREDIGKFVESKLDEYKISTVKGLSQAFSVVISILVIMMMVLGLLIALGFGLALVIGDLLDNYWLGAFIVAGMFLVLTLIFYAVRRKLFRDSLTRLFAGIFMDDNEEDTEDEV